MSKVASIAQILRSRILRGDYLVSDFPSDRDLAPQMRANRLTVRKAIHVLIAEGLLERGENGRAVCTSNIGQQKLTQIAILSPAYSSPNYDWWRLMIERCAQAKDILVRPVDYRHWHDPVVTTTLENFSGVFLWPYKGGIPEEITQLMHRINTPVALLDSSNAELSMPTIQAFTPDSIGVLLEHLVSRGHQRIDLLNTQNFDASINQRFLHWRKWCDARGIQGEFHNYPVEPYQSTVQGGYDAVLKIVAGGTLQPATALLCTTEPTAIGAMRAMLDTGIEPGRDIAICALHDQGLSQYLIPSLTVLERPDPTKSIGLVLDWMKAGGGRWNGPLTLSPQKLDLYEGESTQQYKTPDYAQSYEE